MSFLDRFQFQCNVLNSSVDVIYLDTNERVVSLKLSGFVEWDKLADVLKKENINALRIVFDLSIPIYINLLDLRTQEIIAKAKIDIQIEYMRLLRILIEYLTSQPKK